MKAAAVLRGEPVEAGGPVSWLMGEKPEGPALPLGEGRPPDLFSVQPGGGFPVPGAPETTVQVLPKIVPTVQVKPFQVVGKGEIKVDAIKLVQGKPAFTADTEMRGMLVAKVLHSPVAHAWIRKIDASAARALPVVAAVLTWQDIPRVVYSTAGQSDPIPGPLDAFSLDRKVRFVGDRVAFVAAETGKLPKRPAVNCCGIRGNPRGPGSVRGNAGWGAVLHDEPEYVNFADSNPKKNLAAEIQDRYRRC